MSQGNDGTSGSQNPYGQPGYRPQPGYQPQPGHQMPLGQQFPPGYQPPPGYQMPVWQPFPPSYQPSFDPVTGQSLPPGPPAYSPIDPYASQPGSLGPPPAGYQFVSMYSMVAVPTPKPGAAVAAAVLAFVQAGFVLIGGMFVSTGVDLNIDGGSGRNSAEFTVLGVLLLFVGGLLTAGGITMLNRRSTLLVAGGVLSIALSLYFVIRLGNVVFGLAVWVPILYAVLPIMAIALALGPDVRSWVRSAADAR